VSKRAVQAGLFGALGTLVRSWDFGQLGGASGGVCPYEMFTMCVLAAGEAGDPFGNDAGHCVGTASAAPGGGPS
jgi:hypothetical protein